MNIVLKTPKEVETMRESCRLAAQVLTFIEPHVRPGARTIELDRLCHDFILEHGAVPSPLNYNGYPKSICTSINQVVCHGIPDETVLKEGDIVNLDISTFLNGFHGDTSKTFLVGRCSRAARELVEATEAALWEGIRAVRPSGHVGDIGEAVQKYVESRGYSIVREYCGHGIGRNFHEDPHIVHVGRRGTGPALRPGMTFTIEPMVNQGTKEVVLLEDDWTVETRDSKLSAQFEHTLTIFEDRVEVLTLPEGSSTDPVVWHA